MTPARWDMPEFFAPWPLAAVGVMTLNDQILKARFGNTLTGKLSDLAICFFLPLFLSASMGLVSPRGPRARILLGSVLAAGLFASLELVPSLGVFFVRWVWSPLAPLMGISGRYTMTRDVTDLLCLALVPVAAAYGLHRWRTHTSRGPSCMEAA